MLYLWGTPELREELFLTHEAFSKNTPGSNSFVLSPYFVGFLWCEGKVLLSCLDMFKAKHPHCGLRLPRCGCSLFKVEA